MAPAFVRSGRLDIVASNALCRALYSPMFDSDTTSDRGCANFPRYPVPVSLRDVYVRCGTEERLAFWEVDLPLWADATDCGPRHPDNDSVQPAPRGPAGRPGPSGAPLDGIRQNPPARRLRTEG